MALTKLTTSSITGDTLAAGDIAADAITASELADNAVDSDAYVDGSIDNVHIGTDFNASKISAGTIATARLGSGTASSSTILYGDQTYKTEPTGFDVSSITGATALTVDPASDDEYIINNGGTLNRVDYKHVSNSGKFLVYDAVVTVANATGTIVTGWSESIDENNYFASNRYTPTVPGYYYFGATIRADNPGATARINMGIRKNGGALPSGSFDAETNAVSASYPSVNTSGISYADGDDYFEVHIYHNIGSSHNFFDVGFWGFKLS